jgi:hypothetical protein
MAKRQIIFLIVAIVLAFGGGAAFMSYRAAVLGSASTALQLPTSIIVQPINDQNNPFDNPATPSTSAEIQKLQQEVTNLQNQKPTIIVNNNQNLSITASDLQPYLSGIVRIVCANSDDEMDGSGSLWNFSNLGYSVLTNEHVIDDENSGGINEGVSGGWNSTNAKLPNIPNACAVEFGGSNNMAIYYINLNSAYHWNQEADAASLTLLSNPGWINIAKQIGEDQPVSNLNYSISKLRLCPGNITVGSPVSIIGFPAFGYTADPYGGESPHQIVTTGIISNSFTNDLSTAAPLAYPDYFTSAKMDSGDSGGIAFSKDSNGLCVLGIPTWINSGNYATEGIIQNINNIFDTNNSIK